MPRYESIFIVQPELSEEGFQSIRQSFEKLIQTEGGRVLQSESWGKRRLAYRVGKCEEGYYGFLLLEGSGSIVKELERRYRLHEDVIKYLSVNAPPEGARMVGSAESRRSRTEAGGARETPEGAAPPATPAPAQPPPQEE